MNDPIDIMEQQGIKDTDLLIELSFTLRNQDGLVDALANRYRAWRVLDPNCRAEMLRQTRIGLERIHGSYLERVKMELKRESD